MQHFKIHFSGLITSTESCKVETKEPFVIEGSRIIIRKSSLSLVLIEDDIGPYEFEPPFLYRVETWTHRVILLHSGRPDAYLRVQNKITTDFQVIEVEEFDSDLQPHEVRIERVPAKYDFAGGLLASKVEIVPSLGVIITG